MKSKKIRKNLLKPLHKTTQSIPKQSKLQEILKRKIYYNIYHATIAQAYNYEQEYDDFQMFEEYFYF